MKVAILREAGYDEALLGLSLSYDRPIEAMPAAAVRLCDKDGGHNKFLEHIVVWLLVTAPRYWWQQFDTYRVGVSKQSQSTMHTMMKRDFTQDDFARPIASQTLGRLNELRAGGYFDQLKVELPEGFIQTREVVTNYNALRNIIKQRMHHRLCEWRVFIDAIKTGVQHPELLP